jgi:hypothetical protein
MANTQACWGSVRSADQPRNVATCRRDTPTKCYAVLPNNPPGYANECHKGSLWVCVWWGRHGTQHPALCMPHPVKGAFTSPVPPVRLNHLR